MIPRPPAPFDNPYGAAKLPAPANATQQRTGTGRGYDKSSSPGKSSTKIPNAGGQLITHVGIENTHKTNYAATGDRRPNGYNSINSGFPTKGSTRRAGQIKLPPGPGKNGRK
jgi:hypothetical protein